MNFKNADLCDDFAEDIQVCKLDFKSYGKEKRFFGPIHTVKVLEDNVLVKEALESVPEGSVIVVDGEGSRNCALLGDRLAGIAADRKLAGFIINGYVRDTVDLAEIEIGIFALGSNPLRSKKDGKGARDISVSFGDAAFAPGAFVYADEDGVIISSKPLL